MQELTDNVVVESAERQIRELLNTHPEWFLTQDGSAPLALRNDEFDFSVAHRRLIFSCWTESGSRSWRVTAWSWSGDKLLIHASRRMGAEVATLPGSKIERTVLSSGMRRDQPGRYGRIVLRLPHERVAVTATVAQSDARNVDSLFSSALLWFARLQSSPKRPPINRLLMAVEHNVLEAARQRHVLLRDSLRQRNQVIRD